MRFALASFLQPQHRLMILDSGLQTKPCPLADANPPPLTRENIAALKSPAAYFEAYGLHPPLLPLQHQMENSILWPIILETRGLTIFSSEKAMSKERITDPFHLVGKEVIRNSVGLLRMRNKVLKKITDLLLVLGDP